ncbi:MAG: DsbA family oxidoreductase [Clostridiaceae bacterium]
MKVEIWTDIVCPFCYIGKNIFNRFLAELPEGEEIEVINRSYELQPGASKTTSESTVLYLSRKYGISIEEAKGKMNGVSKMAEANGLTMNAIDAISANTYDLHRLVHLARAKGKEEEMLSGLFTAHFVQNVNLNERIEQLKVAKEAGIAEEDVLSVLNSSEYSDSVDFDKKKARDLSVSGVPYFLFNDKYYVSGAQPKEVFHQVFTQLKTEEQEEN